MRSSYGGYLLDEVSNAHPFVDARETLLGFGALSPARRDPNGSKDPTIPQVFHQGHVIQRQFPEEKRLDRLPLRCELEHARYAAQIYDVLGESSAPHNSRGDAPRDPRVERVLIVKFLEDIKKLG